jgi:site-specific recombinase
MLGQEKVRSVHHQIKKLKRLFSRADNELVLNDLLCQKLSTAILADKMAWLEEILRWLFQKGGQKIETRFRFFFQVLEKNPEWKENFEQTFTALLADCKFLSLFTSIGMAVDHGLWGDIAERVMEKIIPTGGKTDFQEIIFHAFQSKENQPQIDALSDETLLHLQTLLYTPKNEAIWKNVTAQIDEALLFLSIHAAHYGVSSEIRNRLALKEAVSKSAFFNLSVAFQNHTPLVYDSTLTSCESAVDAVYASMEESGVSVDVVNRLETLSAILMQIRNILKLTESEPRLSKVRMVRDFLARTVESGRRGRSVLGHVRHHFYLLSRKIVERNGQSGEHYIARNSSENRSLFLSAIGGGLIVVLMTIFKTWLIRLDPAPLFLATGVWIIYSLGFLAMQFSGCTLATKIPSFTASRLANLLKTVRKLNANEFKNEVKLVIKSQTLALLGNLIGAIPLALLINFLFQSLFQNTGLMNEHYAQHIIHDLNPIFSLAIPLGALTGLQLWLSSVAGGWFENWIVFKRLPTSIRNHYRLRKIFGEAPAKKLGDWVLKHASGVATNIALGFLFGFFPLLGGLFGMNWNGNHVTISTTSAVFAVSSLHYDLPATTWIYTSCGLLLIALMNFAVSFGLALYIAGNAQKMKFWRVLHYLRSSFQKNT